MPGEFWSRSWDLWSETNIEKPSARWSSSPKTQIDDTATRNKWHCSKHTLNPMWPRYKIQKSFSANFCHQQSNFHDLQHNNRHHQRLWPVNHFWWNLYSVFSGRRNFKTSKHDGPFVPIGKQGTVSKHLKIDAKRVSKTIYKINNKRLVPARLVFKSSRNTRRDDASIKNKQKCFLSKIKRTWQGSVVQITSWNFKIIFLLTLRNTLSNGRELFKRERHLIYFKRAHF